MKIFHINVSFTLGGLETMLIDIMNEQCKYAEVHLLITNDKVDYDLLKGMDKSIKCHFLGRQEGSLSPWFFLRLNYILFINKPDIVHCHHFKVGPAIFRTFKFKMFLTVHDMRFTIKYYNLYDTIFAISRSVADDIFERSGYVAQVVYNGIDFGKIKRRINLEETTGKFRIVQISRLVHLKKGQHLLLGAVKKLITEYNYNNIEVDFIGDGESLQYLQELTEEYNLTKVVRFLGNQDRDYIYDNLHNYSLLVQPSLYEGFGLTIIEGIGANIPVITSDVDGPKEIATTLNSDILFKRGSVEELLKAISNIYIKINKMPEVVLAGSVKLNERAREAFSIENTTSNYLKQYKKK
jgi:glycosyltransferase involved in cell wall biosynthesis